MEILKKYWIMAAGALLVILIIGYLGRHKIRTMLGLTPSQPVVQATTSPTNSNVPSNNIYQTKTDPAKGNYLADFQGMTLYIFDKDTSGVSNCNGSCATLWPPYASGATAQYQLPENITVITRSDGSKQFAWKGMPLYYYAKDKNPGDIIGDGVGGIWHLVKP